MQNRWKYLGYAHYVTERNTVVPLKVAAICLTADRQEYTDRAVDCFLTQSHDERHLLIYDTGKEPYRLVRHPLITIIRDRGRVAPIGALRNLANAQSGPSELIMHWDSDDHSARYRMEYQLDQFATVGKDFDYIGFRNMLFWDVGARQAWMFRHARLDYAVGTSMCYRRRSWERFHFPETSGEDTHWQRHMKGTGFTLDLAMIADIHGANTCSKIDPSYPEWTRREDLDEFCQSRSLEAFLAPKIGVG